MITYDHKKIEKKWQKKWGDSGIYKTADNSNKPKTFVLDMFPYPSGEGLHVGHPRGYIATDIYSRHCRMQGKNVLHPMGWDAFGLPAENYALKNKVHPRKAVEKNIANFKSQLSKIGFDYDWSREINTTDPEYYKWTQWIFLQLFKKGLAYQSNEPINWCPSCMTGLANEDLDGDLCERCGTKVEKKALPQWVLKITAYADRMLDDLSLLNWPEHIKEAQRNWIGRSEGAEIEFEVSQTNLTIKVFTTRPDTLFGATYMVLAPEHALVREFLSKIQNKNEVLRYIEVSREKSDIERNAEGKEKTGVELKGIKAINPANKKEIPVFIADYVLGGYGTGAIMAVPAHDERDREFAKKFDLPVKDEPFVDGKKITEQVGGRMTTMYKLKDWVFSRQRYWGEPIPIIHCPKDGAVAVPEKDLPVLLPDVEAYEPSGTGESPLANIPEWVNTTCPTCGGPAKRETNTMPQWAGSSWYYLRFMDPHNAEALVSKEHEKYWDPVDVYVGGDHAVRHLIYARFWHKFLYDIGAVSVPEPFARLEFLGFILAEDGRKMSKRYGNIINPDDVVAQYGADTFRLYEMFIGPFENTTAWNTNAIVGTARFVERVWRLHEKVVDEQVLALDSTVEQTVKKVSEDIEAFKFNTAVSQMMICLNAFEKEGRVGRMQWEKFLQILAPFAPHIADELWEDLGHTESIHVSVWPLADVSKLVSATATIAVQINGKVRGRVEIATNASETEALAAARANPAVALWLAKGKELKALYVPGRIISFVLG
ncbi:MAG TPA: class I tRNA ligase family protein [Candidatus Paceibacterota bacterium]|nr:class I tRNA ligase family protein [Candidatus Paceibacterota bacterium]